jgi:predicted metal-dependent hydrolase
MAGTIHHDSVWFGETEIAYSLRRSSERKTLAITVCGPWVEVIAPAGMRAAAVRPHVVRKGAWIVAKLDLARRQPSIYPAELQSGMSIRFFGRQHQLRIRRDDPSARVERRAGRFDLSLKSGMSHEQTRELFKRHFKAELATVLQSWIGELAAKLGIPAPPFKVMELGNRWGSCAPSGVLRFHWLLATQTPDFIRHVVAHELCHLTEPRHSQAFFRLLRRLDPT